MEKFLLIEWNETNFFKGEKGILLKKKEIESEF